MIKTASKFAYGEMKFFFSDFQSLMCACAALNPENTSQYLDYVYCLCIISAGASTVLLQQIKCKYCIICALVAY